MAVPRLVPSVVMITTAILLSHTGMSMARSPVVQTDDDSLSQLLGKRNSWWSKKSVDTSSRFTSILPGNNLDTSDMAENSPDAYSELYECYTTGCVPYFITCVNHSRTTQTFRICKMYHRACAMRCLELANDDSSSMK